MWAKRHAFLVLAASALSACVSTQIDEIPPSIETLKILRSQAIPMLALGAFGDADKVKIGHSVNIRGSTINAPKGGTFADFLKQTVQAELQAAGKFDAASTTMLTASLTESRAGENLSKGGAALGAEFHVQKDGATIFAKQYRVESKWKSDFIGAIAIPEAFRQYNGLYAVLVREAFSDPDLIAALKK